ncbi:MAG TPA: OsmC family protein [Chloroflexi bacterium]|nr:OsmC family protein [Chloroflexota bacterium]
MGQIALHWVGHDSTMFITRDSFGHMVVAGSWPKDGEEGWIEWKGVKPSDLLVMALVSCSGYDVVTILRRQRQELTDLRITADAQQASEPPYQFTDIHLHYVVTGRDLDPAKVERAIKLSEEKYCSVAATIRGVANITNSFEVRQEQ